MSGVDDLVEFLRARLDEREAAAKAATEGPWRVDEYGEVATVQLYGNPGYERPLQVTQDSEGITSACDGPDAIFIALNDPQFVLDDIAAKREMLDELERVADSGHLDGDGRCYDCGVMPERLLRRIAAAFAAHPDFDPAWKVD